jgi:hypothetical protein
VRVEDIYATIYASIAGGPCEKRLIDERAAWTESKAGHLIATGNLQELWNRGDGLEREIGTANFRCAIGFLSEE